MDNRFVITPLEPAGKSLRELLPEVTWRHRGSALQVGGQAQAGFSADSVPDGLSVWRRPLSSGARLSGAWRAAEASFRKLAARGIPTPQVFARGVARASGGGRSEVLLVADWPAGSYLDTFFLEDFKQVSARRWHALVRGFGRLIRTLFERGVEPAPLALEGFWISTGAQGDSFQIADPQRFRRRRGPLSERRRLRCLSQLYARMLSCTTRSERFRFLQAVWGGERAGALRPLALRIERAALPMARRRWRRQARLCLADNPQFATARRGAWRIWRRRGAAIAGLLDKLLPEPAALVGQGCSMGGRGSGCSAGKIVVDGRSFFVKRYRRQGWRYALKYLFCSSPGLTAWHTGWHFHARGLPAAQPLLLMERRRFRVFREAYVFYAFCEDGQPLMELWPRMNPAEKRNVIVRSAQLLARVHLCRCLHGDSNWNNILLRKGGALLLVDLDCARIMTSFDYARAYRDLEHFVRDLRRKRNNGVAYRDLFMAVWRRGLGLAGRVDLQAHERVVRAHPGRKIDDCI